jgi:hypothetical protein
VISRLWRTRSVGGYLAAMAGVYPHFSCCHNLVSLRQTLLPRKL